MSDDRGWFDRFVRKLLHAEDVSPITEKRETIRARDVLRLYGTSVAKHKQAVTYVLFGSAATSVIGVIIPLFYKEFFDNLVGTGTPEKTAILVHTILLILLLALLRWGTMSLRMFSMTHLAATVMADLKQRAFAYMIRHSHRFFVSTFTGSLVQRVNRFAHSYDRLADRVVYDIIPVSIQIIGVITVLSATMPIMGFIIIGWLIAFLGVNYVLALFKLKYDIARAAADSRSSGTLADIITNQQTVEAHGSHEAEIHNYEEATDHQKRISRFTWNLSVCADILLTLLVILVEFVVFYVGIKLWSEGKFTIGAFVLMQAYIFSLAERMWSFSRIIRDIYESFADAKEMAEIIERPHEVADRPEAAMLDDARGTLEFNNVSFAFQEKPVLKNISFTVKAGERVALVGVSGAGKSTMTKLLFRFFDPIEGDILIDGKSVRDFTLKSLRNTLALVPQDPSLFHRSLMENIRYGRSDATDKEVIASATLARADDFIRTLPEGYDTLVGERGIKLSGGERQRVALARAFLRNAPILVLDEATSSLDSESERLIQEALMNLMEGRTTLIIAHRLSTIRRMDRILIIHDGAIVENGTHEELLKNKGTYWKLWTLQQSGFIPEKI